MAERTTGATCHFSTARCSTIGSAPCCATDRSRCTRRSATASPRSDCARSNTRADSRLGRARGAPRAATEREAQLLELLVEGLTNREIGERLILGTRTVETHVERILGRLGVGSRTRAIAAAPRLGLVVPQSG